MEMSDSRSRPWWTWCSCSPLLHGFGRFPDQTRELTINLPSGKAAAGPDVPKTPLIIDIFPDGKVQMNNKVYDNPGSRELPELRAKLADTINKFGDKGPGHHPPDPQTKHERIIDVLNAAAASGVKNLTFS